MVDRPAVSVMSPYSTTEAYKSLPDMPLDAQDWNDLYLSKQWHFLQMIKPIPSHIVVEEEAAQLEHTAVLLRKMQDCVSASAWLARSLQNHELEQHFLSGLDCVTGDLREILDLTTRGRYPSPPKTR
jgi:hypothetical protein